MLQPVSVDEIFRSQCFRNFSTNVNVNFFNPGTERYCFGNLRALACKVVTPFEQLNTSMCVIRRVNKISNLVTTNDAAQYGYGLFKPIGLKPIPMGFKVKFRRKLSKIR